MQSQLKDKKIYIVVGKNYNILNVFFYYSKAIEFIDNLNDENKNVSSIIEKEIEF
jgi:hypothetical protein